ncbi:PAS domain S-box protein [Bacteroidota bacterium]
MREVNKNNNETQVQQVIDQNPEILYEISECVKEIFKILSTGNLFEYLTDKLHQLSENIIISAIFSEIDNKFSIKYIAGLNKWQNQVEKIIGRKIIGLDLSISENIKKQIVLNKIFKLEDNLHPLLNSLLSKPECLALEKILNLKETYCIGYSNNSDVFGLSLFIVSYNKTINNPENIQFFCDLISKALHKNYEVERLKQTINQQNELIETTDDLLYFKDLNGINKYINKAYADFVGKSINEIIGKTDWEILPHDLAQKCYDSDQKIIKTSKKESIFEHCESKDGSRLCFHTTKRPVYNEDGEIIGIAGVSKDISKILELDNYIKDKDKNFIAFINALPNSYFEVDNNLDLIFINNNSFEIFDIKNNSPEKKTNIRNYISKKERISFDQYISDVLNTNKPLTKEFNFIKKGKYDSPISICSSVIIENNEVKGVRGLITEIIDKKMIEQMLEEYENRFNTFIESARDLMYVVDDEGYFTYVNNFMVKTLGYSRKELIGLHESKLIDISVINNFETSKIKNKLINKKQLTVNTIWLTKYDEKIPGEINMFAIFDEENNYLGYRGIFYDKTEIKNSKNEIRKLYNAVEHSPEAIIITNKKGIIEYVNPKFSETTGYKKEEVLGKTPDFLTTERQDKQFYRKLWRTLLSGKEWRGEFENIRKNGDIFWQNTSISKVLNEEGEITHFVAINEDITERKLTEQKLIQAKEFAEQADKIKTAFLSNMSHEIRTPMNAIIGFSELLKITDLAHDKKLEYIDHINENGKILLKLFEDIIDVARIESGDLDISKNHFNLNELVQNIYFVFDSKLKELAKPINLEIKSPNHNEPFIMYSDPVRCGQILTNLIDNALKFTQEGKVVFGYEILDEKEILFYVKDTGIGLSEEQQNIIFDLFRQADSSTTRKFGGTGIGLTISKNLVEMLGGKIWIESKLEIGTSFNFTLPYKKDDDTTMIEEIPDKKSLNWNNKTVLIAEDNESNFLFLQEILDDTNIKIIWAKDGNEAIEIFKSEPSIDIILMDIQMPGLNGYDAAKIIKEIKPDIPVIAQTAYALTGEEERSSEAGCDEYIAKPINVQKLSAILSKYLN